MDTVISEFVRTLVASYSDCTNATYLEKCIIHKFLKRNISEILLIVTSKFRINESPRCSNYSNFDCFQISRVFPCSQATYRRTTSLTDADGPEQNNFLLKLAQKDNRRPPSNYNSSSAVLPHWQTFCKLL